ncbi:uncharacterized protein TNCV_3577131 [Trichonephila clavipes]|uniref:Uncharacterized protein n=1 Tax=Trichonephila clavipes TaxID=2585209 RepID=A0A8X6RBE2_TRICX|nr:uncharacterized protein TNCV_3577131 [Trichonephila clavipes]
MCWTTYSVVQWSVPAAETSGVRPVGKQAQWLEHRFPDWKTWVRRPMPQNTLRVHTEYVLVKSLGPKVLWAVAAETTSAEDWRIFPCPPAPCLNCGDGDRWCRHLS